MVAQVSNDTFARGFLSPAPEPTDSDDLALALDTARALEAQGETRDAVRWLRRAADVAERDGNDRRVVALAGAAADLTGSVDTPPAAKPPAWSLAPAVIPAP